MAAHPWLRDQQQHIPLDMLIYKLVKAYLRATPLKRAALKVLSCFSKSLILKAVQKLRISILEISFLLLICSL